MSPVKRICVFEHSVMTVFNCACPVIQRAQWSGFLSEGSSSLTARIGDKYQIRLTRSKWRKLTINYPQIPSLSVSLLQKPGMALFPVLRWFTFIFPHLAFDWCSYFLSNRITAFCNPTALVLMWLDVDSLNLYSSLAPTMATVRESVSDVQTLRIISLNTEGVLLTLALLFSLVGATSPSADLFFFCYCTDISWLSIYV